MSADLNAIKARLQSREAFRVRGVTTWTSEADADIAALIKALEEVRADRDRWQAAAKALEKKVLGLANERDSHMGADWLNGRSDS